MLQMMGGLFLKSEHTIRWIPLGKYYRAATISAYLRKEMVNMSASGIWLILTR